MPFWYSKYSKIFKIVICSKKTLMSSWRIFIHDVLVFAVHSTNDPYNLVIWVAPIVNYQDNRTQYLPDKKHTRFFFPKRCVKHFDQFFGWIWRSSTVRIWYDIFQLNLSIAWITFNKWNWTIDFIIIKIDSIFSTLIKQYVECMNPEIPMIWI